MKNSKTIFLFRIAILFYLNVYFKNIFLFIISVIILFLLDKKESVILIILLSLSLIKLPNLIPIGYVSNVNSKYSTVNSLVYKTVLYDTNLEVGDFVYLSDSSINDDFDNFSSYYLFKAQKGKTILANTPFKLSLKHLDKFDNDTKNLLKKTIFNDYVSDNDLLVSVGYGFGLYFLLKKIFDKNKYLSLFLIVSYSIFFDFEFKLLFIIIDFVLSYFSFDSINNLSIKAIFITLINYRLLSTSSILLTLLFSFIYLSEYKNCRFLLGVIQSLFFGQVNIFVSIFYSLYLNIRIIIFLISLFCFILPFSSPFYLLLMKIIGFVLDILLISIRGKISLLSCVVIIIFYLFGLKKDYQLYICLLFCLLCLNNPFKHVTFIDVGQGDAALLSSYNYKVLVDTGSSYNYHKLRKALYSQGVYTIDYLLISHSDEDHNGNIENLKNDFKIKNIITSEGDISYKDLYLKNFYLGTFDNENDGSLIYKTEINGLSFLFTGDISQNIERLLVNTYDVGDIGVLKVSHHGSYTGTSEYFIGNILPSFAIISTNGKYNHPHQDTLNTLDAYLVDYLITKMEGDITFNLSFIKFIKTNKKLIFLNS